MGRDALVPPKCRVFLSRDHSRHREAWKCPCIAQPLALSGDSIHRSLERFISYSSAAHVQLPPPNCGKVNTAPPRKKGRCLSVVTISPAEASENEIPRVEIIEIHVLDLDAVIRSQSQDHVVT